MPQQRTTRSPRQHDQVEVYYNEKEGGWCPGIVLMVLCSVMYVLFEEGVFPVSLRDKRVWRPVQLDEATRQAIAGVLTPGSFVVFAYPTDPNRNVYGEVVDFDQLTGDLTVRTPDGELSVFNCVSNHNNWMPATAAETDEFVKGKQLAQQAQNCSKGGGCGAGQGVGSGTSWYRVGSGNESGSGGGGSSSGTSSGTSSGSSGTSSGTSSGSSGTSSGSGGSSGSSSGGGGGDDERAKWLGELAEAKRQLALQARGGGDPETRTRHLHFAARAAWCLGNLGDAASYYEEAIELCNTMDPVDGSMRLVTLILQLGLVYQKQETPGALYMLSKGASMLNSIFVADPKTVADFVTHCDHGKKAGYRHLVSCVQLCARMHAKALTLGEARRYFNLALDLAEQAAGGAADLTIANLCDEMARLAHKERRFDDALDLRVKALNIKRQKFGTTMMDQDSSAAASMKRATERVERATKRAERAKAAAPHGCKRKPSGEASGGGGGGGGGACARRK